MTEKQALLNTYTSLFATHVETGHSSINAAILVAETYLDGKPRKRGKRKITQTERDAAFWHGDFLTTLPADAWHTETLVLALARYLGQERVSNVALLENIAATAPAVVRRAARYSGLVLQGQSLRRSEIEQLAEKWPVEFGAFVQILNTFDRAYHEHQSDVDHYKQLLSQLTPLELLTYASLYAFEQIVPRDLLSLSPPADPDTHTQIIWEAINDLLIWKLSSADDDAFRLTEHVIGKSLGTHLSPFLFPSTDGPEPREDLYRAFEELLSAQIELNSFVSRSADAFSFDDSIEFALRDGALEVIDRDTAEKSVWERNGDRLTQLHYYWFYRAVDEYAASEMATAFIGRPEHNEANRIAYIKAMRTYLQLTEVYGLTDSVTTESGLRVDLFQALLSLELMTAFFNADFMLPYMQYYDEMRDSRLALGRLAFSGMMQADMQIRFPITWSDRAEKITKITGWTVNSDFPQGSAKAAEAILDFWTIDWAALSARLRKGEKGLHPELFERPILKMGRYLFQLPWVVAMQNNATAATNNLRRIGARRREARGETLRIEERLAKLFEGRDFSVQLNYQPERHADDDPGEVDLICARDGQVLALEIKSTFLRSTKKEAWLHGKITLRKAGLQLRRKVPAIEKALTADTGLARVLDIDPFASHLPIIGWIIDTSIEHDHEHFSGYLKVSVEEVIIALRDDRHLLNAPDGLLDGSTERTEDVHLPKPDVVQSLYPEGFSASYFIEVIENETVWDKPPLN